MGGEEGNQGRKLVLVPSGQSSNMQVGRGQHGGADAAGQSRESSKVVVETKVAGWELRLLLGGARGAGVVGPAKKNGSIKSKSTAQQRASGGGGGGGGGRPKGTGKLAAERERERERLTGRSRVP